MQCPDEKCRDYQQGMQNLSPHSNGYTNFYCHSCKCHYAGKEGKEQWYTRKQWDDYVNVIDGVDWREKIKEVWY
jgi:hypothetical protein